MSIITFRGTKIVIKSVHLTRFDIIFDFFHLIV